eukprot:s1322_g23.t1
MAKLCLPKWWHRWARRFQRSRAERAEHRKGVHPALDGVKFVVPEVGQMTIPAKFRAVMVAFRKSRSPWLMWAICLSRSAVSWAYFTGEYGNATCGEGERQVPHESCEAAVLALGFFWIGDMSSGVTLPGCQTDGINGYYNSATDTQVNVRFAPICELDISSTSTSSSSSSTTTSSSRSTGTTSSATKTVTSSSSVTVETTLEAAEAQRTSVATTSTTDLPADPGGEWNLLGDGTLERIHSVPRRNLFTPTDVEDCPVAIGTLSSLRTTFVSYVQGGTMSITAAWAMVSG